MAEKTRFDDFSLQKRTSVTIVTDDYADPLLYQDIGLPHQSPTPIGVVSWVGVRSLFEGVGKFISLQYCLVGGREDSVNAKLASARLSKYYMRKLSAGLTSPANPCRAQIGPTEP